MAAGGYLGNGIRVAYATGSPHTYKKLEQVLDAKPPAAVASDVDVTVHGTGDFMSNIPGLAKVADMTIKMLRDHSSVTAPNQNSLFALRAAKTQVYWRIEIPDGPDLSVALFEAYEFQGRVKSWQPTTPINGKQEVDVAVVFSGTYLTQYAPAASVIG